MDEMVDAVAAANRHAEVEQEAAHARYLDAMSGTEDPVGETQRFVEMAAAIERARREAVGVARSARFARLDRATTRVLQ